MNTDYSKMKYNDLKKLAKERGLDASGTSEELCERLLANESTDGDDQDDQSGQTGDQSSVVSPKTAQSESQNGEKPFRAPTEAQEREGQRKADKALKESARQMKEALDAQPKVSMMIPFDPGVKPEDATKIPFHINLNGYVMNLPRGVYIDVPKQVADVIRERLESEGKIGKEWRTDRDQKTQEALG